MGKSCCWRGDFSAYWCGKVVVLGSCVCLVPANTASSPVYGPLAHAGPMTCTWARRHVCGQRRPRACLGVYVHIQGLTCGRAAEGETELVRHCRCGAFSVTKFARRGRFGGARVTKFALLAKIRAFWAVWRMQGEFCPVLAASKLSGESFVPVLASLRKTGRVLSRRCPLGGHHRTCGASMRRPWVVAGPGRAVDSAKPRPIGGRCTTR